MKYKLLLFFIFFVYSIKAQQLDSIPYSQGYLYYHVYGKSGAPIVILSGGPGANCMQEETVAIELSSKFKCYLLEQRGTGLSQPKVLDSTTITVKNAEDDITLLLDHLHFKEVTLFGHSWGGMLGLSYAVHHPNRIKKLLLLGTGEIKSDEKVFKVIDDLMATRMDSLTHIKIAVAKEKIENNTATDAEKIFFKKTTLSYYFNDKSRADSIYKKFSTFKKADPKMSVLMWNDFERTKFDLTIPLKSFNKPMYILCGREDFFAFLSYELKIAKPSAHLHWIEESGHFPMFENPKEFYKLLYEILDE
ncbi:MAG: alpha/beta hydrolase [Flavobacterium sp.]|nr:alpha/beta hydrolase [Flavobacterium sp.]